MKIYTILGQYQDDSTILRAFTHTQPLKEFLGMLEKPKDSIDMLNNWKFVVDGYLWSLTLYIFENNNTPTIVPIFDNTVDEIVASIDENQEN